MGKRVQSATTRHSNGSRAVRHTVIHEHPPARAPRFETLQTVMRRSHPTEPQARRPAWQRQHTPGFRD